MAYCKLQIVFNNLLLATRTLLFFDPRPSHFMRENVALSRFPLLLAQFVIYIQNRLHSVARGNIVLLV